METPELKRKTSYKPIDLEPYKSEVETYLKSGLLKKNGILDMDTALTVVSLGFLKGWAPIQSLIHFIHVFEDDKGNKLLTYSTRAIMSLLNEFGYEIRLMQDFSPGTMEYVVNNTKTTINGMQVQMQLYKNGKSISPVITSHSSMYSHLLHKTNWKNYLHDMLFWRGAMGLCRKFVSHIMDGVYEYSEVADALDISYSIDDSGNINNDSKSLRVPDLNNIRNLVEHNPDMMNIEKDITQNTFSATDFKPESESFSFSGKVVEKEEPKKEVISTTVFGAGFTDDDDDLFKKPLAKEKPIKKSVDSPKKDNPIDGDVMNFSFS